ncbi:MAG: UDP-N-acetylglucosamine 1-carboxyvinyltransferase [Patescibacteria group bacterium]
MDKFIIQGQNTLSGEIKVAGAKNAALKILAATLLSDQEWHFKNVPDITDIWIMIELLKDLGVKIEKINKNEYKIQAKNICKNELDPKLVHKLRSSVVLLGPLLSRCGEVKFPHPGGCVIGRRPIDIFLDNFKNAGAEIEVKNRYYHIKAKRLRGAKFVFPWISHTATESAISQAVLAKGKTILINAACEPEVEFLAKSLIKCGAKIKGAGTPYIEIEGVDKISGGEFDIIPDRIETGTFAILGALTGDPIKITNCDTSHLDVFWKMLIKAGAKFDIGKNFVNIKKSKNLFACEIRTHEYPGFATDLQPPFTVLMTQCYGMSLMHETIYEGRLLYTDILNRMGAKIIMCDPHRVVVSGSTKLYGAKIESPDLRAGIALLIAALIAEGKSEIENIYQIDRGYEDIEGRLKQLGAKIERVKE